MNPVPKYSQRGWIKTTLYHSDLVSEYVRHPKVGVEVRPVSRRESDRYQKVQADSTIRIPRWIVEELGLDVGTEVWIDILDEDLKQVVIGKRKLQGEERGRAIDKLEELMTGRNELWDNRTLRD